MEPFSSLLYTGMTPTQHTLIRTSKRARSLSRYIYMWRLLIIYIYIYIYMCVDVYLDIRYAHAFACFPSRLANYHFIWFLWTWTIATTCFRSMFLRKTWQSLQTTKWDLNFKIRCDVIYVSTRYSHHPKSSFTRESESQIQSLLPYAANGRLEHTEFLTVDLAFTLTSGAALIVLTVEWKPINFLYSMLDLVLRDCTCTGSQILFWSIRSTDEHVARQARSEEALSNGLRARDFLGEVKLHRLGVRSLPVA